MWIHLFMVGEALDFYFPLVVTDCKNCVFLRLVIILSYIIYVIITLSFFSVQTQLMT